MPSFRYLYTIVPLDPDTFWWLSKERPKFGVERLRSDGRREHCPGIEYSSREEVQAWIDRCHNNPSYVWVEITS